jgi:NAD(P)-dependent dehydrogenase (short-subunit alcohol dehydrogenase family)
MGSLDGRVIVITGGAAGLGLAVAQRAAAEGAGGLVLVGRDHAKGDAAVAALAAAGTEAVFVAVDLADRGAAGVVGAATDARFGVVHGLVNSAAETGRGSVWDTTAEVFDRMLAVNVRTPFLLTQAMATIMRREGVGGSIVNIGSVSGYGGDVFLTPYATSKGALHAMTRNCAFSLMRNGIRVNLVNPGWMDTPAEDAVQRYWHGAPDGWLADAEARQPFGRLIKPAELARTICFVLSEESGMMTGAVIDYDQSVLGAGSVSKPGPEEVWPR